MIFLDELSKALLIIIILLAVLLIGVQIGKKTRPPAEVHQMSPGQERGINIHLIIS